MSSKNYYEILELKKENDPTPEKIKKAYRKLALQYHPDKNPSGEARFKEILEAYQVLSDPILKAQYDKTGSAPSKSSGGGIGAPKVFDYETRIAADKEIENALKKHDFSFYNLN